MSDRVEAESDEAKRILRSLRDILVVPKLEVDAKLKIEKRQQARRKSKRERRAKTTSFTQAPKA